MKLLKNKETGVVIPYNEYAAELSEMEVFEDAPKAPAKTTRRKKTTKPE